MSDTGAIDDPPGRAPPRLNDDLTNVLSAVEIPIVILGCDARVRRFTPAAAKLFRLGAGDIGRPFGDASPLAARLELGHMIGDVLEHLGGVERTVQDEAGRWYQITVRPYLTVDNRIGGTVLTAFDIDHVKREERFVDEARAFAENVDEKLADYQANLQKVVFDAAVAAERERRRIAIDLHDRIGQALSLAQIKLTSMRESVTGLSRAVVDEGIALIAQSISDARTLIFDLSPPVLYDLGLREALSWLIEDVEKRHGLHVELVDDATEKPLDEVAAALVFRAVRELLMNVLKHARSPSATVSLRRVGDLVEVEVADRGVGFTPEDLTAREGGPGFGLFSVREQMSRLGGNIDVASVPGRGTQVSIRVPVRPATPRAGNTDGATPS